MTEWIPAMELTKMDASRDGRSLHKLRLQLQLIAGLETDDRLEKREQVK